MGQVDPILAGFKIVPTTGYLALRYTAHIGLHTLFTSSSIQILITEPTAGVTCHMTPHL